MEMLQSSLITMKNNRNYIFTSDRLGFREWLDCDLDQFTELNADPVIMEHLPKVLSKNETAHFIERLQNHYKQYGHCYFATEILETGEFIGFIGMAYQVYPTDFTPAVDIGWRLKQSSWGNGYATEGAKRNLEYAFNDLKLDRVISTCTVDNTNSENVMKKIGMKKLKNFDHPLLKGQPLLEKCMVYIIEK